MGVFKYVCVCFLLFFAGCAGMQVLPETDKTVTAVVDIPGKTKDQIYIGAKTWIAETFRSAKAVIEVDSKEDGLIIGNGNIPYPCAGAADCLGAGTFKVGFTMKCEIKDAKYRVIFSNIRILTPGQAGVHSSGDNPIYWQKDMDKIRPKLLELSDELASSIKGKSKSDF